MSSELNPVVVIVAVAVVAYALLMGPVFQLWLKAMLSKAPIPPLTIVAMRLRGMKAPVIVDSYVQMKARGVDIDIGSLMDLYQASPREFTSNAAKLADEAIAAKK